MIHTTPRASLKPAAARLALACTSLLLATSAHALGVPSNDGPTLEEKYAIRAGKVMTLDGEPIENGVVIVDAGRITAVGKEGEVEIPWDAEVLEVPDMIAMPGFVEAVTHRGMDRSNETIDVAAFLDVRDSVDPVNFYFENCLRWGVTTCNVQQGANTVIAGRGMIVKPWGMTVEAMQVRPEAGVHISVQPKSGKSRATQKMALRQAFADLRRYLEGLVAEKREGQDTARREALAQGRDLESEEAKETRAMSGSGWTVEGLELVPRGEIDEKQAPLLAIVEGRIPVFMTCSTPSDVLAGLEIAKDNGFLEGLTLVLGPACWKVADQIKDAGVKVVLSPNLTHTETDPVTEEETETFVPKVFLDKGITFALASLNDSTQSLWFQAAKAVAGGLTREQALAAVTTTPAKMLGLEGRVGVLKAGADADVVLYSGDPLSVTSFVEYVMVNGELVYDRSKDVRVKYLLEGVEPAGSAMDPSVEPEDIHAGETSNEKKKDDQ